MGVWGADSKGVGLSLALTRFWVLLGLGPPPLHQGMAPAFPPGLGGSLPSAYQFVRDPQSGQLVVIPSDHLPHFGKWWPLGGGLMGRRQTGASRMF